MPIFQYQQLFEPLLPIIPPPAPLGSWYPVYPDRVPHRRSQVAPSFFYGNPSSFPPPEVRESQAAVETLIAYAQPLARLSGAPIELLTQYAIGIRQVRLSQAAVEVIYPFGCHRFVPPQPAACVVALVPLVPLSSVPACPIPGSDGAVGGGGGGVDSSGGVG